MDQCVKGGRPEGRLPMVAGALLSLALAACSSVPPAPSGQAAKIDRGPATSSETIDRVWLIAGPRYPLSREQRATTDPALTLGNLQSRITVLQRQLEERQDGMAAAQLSAALLQRGQILGRLDDQPLALHWAEQAVAWRSDAAETWLAQASAQAALHRFGPAQASLKQAMALGLPAAASIGLQRDISVALGDYQSLSRDFEQAALPDGDFGTLTHRADLLLLKGDLRGASLWLRTAQDFYHDVNPLPLAWLYTQQGIALLRFGQIEEARVFFAAAHQRLPTYFLATEHLAECETLLGNFDEARKLYVQVVEQTGNPEFMAALAELEQQVGDEVRAKDWRDLADQGFQDLVTRDEAAHAAHAVEFWLETGRTDEEVLALARRNAERRADLASLILAARAEFALGAAERGCSLMARIDQTGLQPPELTEVEHYRPRCAVGSSSASKSGSFDRQYHQKSTKLTGA